eukprot:CAMPEP_0202914752 /NCGR_PEP_ID=MMETSP1392-20130828/63866_1 /ASSEMBLY_ACC=CAM_ASM_000868 /TAXON_ID=225041 /ORGANISM="Chlamydomonas chlamydogama, Strain SAG 11-48b" /LENGTH=216 /DNA_ID=CAMNT_0049606527 /DNA_START=183 /DNA_END=830 /DNA_ORIENTATION=+
MDCANPRENGVLTALRDKDVIISNQAELIAHLERFAFGLASSLKGAKVACGTKDDVLPQLQRCVEAQQQDIMRLQEKVNSLCEAAAEREERVQALQREVQELKYNLQVMREQHEQQRAEICTHEQVDQGVSATSPLEAVTGGRGARKLLHHTEGGCGQDVQTPRDITTRTPRPVHFLSPSPVVVNTQCNEEEWRGGGVAVGPVPVPLLPLLRLPSW